MSLLKQLTVAVTGLGLLIGGASTIHAEELDKTGWPTSIKVGTASQGGTYFIYGSGWAGLVQESLGINASPEVTGGPVQNMALIQGGKLEFGMTTMGPAYEAWTGNSPIAPGMEMQDVRAMFPMYKTGFQFVALKSSGINSIDDLQDKKVGYGPRGGTNGSNVPNWLRMLGIQTKEQYGGASDLAGQLQDGLIDAFSFAAGIPISAFSQVEAQADVVFFSFDDEQIKKMLDKYPSITAFTIPADTYKSLPEDQNTVAMWNFTVTHKDMPESLVYGIMKTVLDNNDKMLQIHKASAETLVENWDKNGFLYFHPGAVRYYKEKGIEIPKELMPPEAKG